MQPLNESITKSSAVFAIKVEKLLIMSVKLKAELKLWFKWFTLPPNQRQQLLCITHSLSQIHFQHRHQAQAQQWK
ncbi:hypothetical protein T11_17690 [Trichinella zimbabwensis]|uniref:Uncharacterized protein n=1 Tax=Trichinella zimbabwensis TaxID=268475 RepID=A0A0V1GWH1_9BILA|nr:hypothetical protein T11_17690 [Trichinella zimbabwensis]